MLYPPRVPGPRRVHHDADEVSQVLAGRMVFRIGDQEVVGEAGATVYAPRGVPHGFSVTSEEPAHYLITYTPAGFEGFIRDASEPAPARLLPPPSGPP